MVCCVASLSVQPVSVFVSISCVSNSQILPSLDYFSLVHQLSINLSTPSNMYSLEVILRTERIPSKSFFGNHNIKVFITENNSAEEKKKQKNRNRNSF